MPLIKSFNQLGQYKALLSAVDTLACNKNLLDEFITALEGEGNEHIAKRMKTLQRAAQYVNYQVTNPPKLLCGMPSIDDIFERPTGWSHVFDVDTITRLYVLPEHIAVTHEKGVLLWLVQYSCMRGGYYWYRKTYYNLSKTHFKNATRPGVHVFHQYNAQNFVLVMHEDYSFAMQLTINWIDATRFEVVAEAVDDPVCEPPAISTDEFMKLLTDPDE